MTDTQRNLAVGFVLVLALGAGGYYVMKNGGPAGFFPGFAPTATTTTVSGVTGTGEFAVEAVGVPVPALTPVSITADLSEDAKVILRRQIEAQYEILRKEPTRVDIWLQLGVNRKIGGDYQGAIAAWEYVAATAPTAMVATARGNLGDLYMYFLRDYAKAKQHLSAAIVANPNIIEYYRALFYLEKDINKDTAAARAVVDLGLKNNPDHPDLLKLKALL